MVVGTHEAEVALEVGAVLGEGPIWDDRAEELLFVDILANAVHAFGPSDRAHRSFEVDRTVGAVVLREDGGLVLAAHDGFFVAERDGSGFARIGEFRTDAERVRFNDGKVDPWGRFLAGTMHWGESDALGSLYLLRGDGTVETLIEGVVVSNGLAWSADGGTVYYIDTPRCCVDAFDVDPETGRIANRRVAAEIADGHPDGMAIDDEGMLWVAIWGGSRVERIDPAGGRRLAVVSVPAPLVTSVAFGGSGLDELYVTTARRDLDEAGLASSPHSGDLFVVRPGVSGPAPFRYQAV